MNIRHVTLEITTMHTHNRYENTERDSILSVYSLIDRSTLTYSLHEITNIRTQFLCRAYNVLYIKY